MPADDQQQVHRLALQLAGVQPLFATDRPLELGPALDLLLGELGLDVLEELIAEAVLLLGPSARSGAMISFMTS
jgi:hypothetical protein